MKANVILNAVLLLILYTALNFGVRKLLKWDLENDKRNGKKKNQPRKKNRKRKKQHSYVPLTEGQKMSKKQTLGGLSVDYICMLILCLGIIVYALIYIP